MTVLHLHIERVAPGAYETRLVDGGVEVTEPSTYSSISEAIANEASAVPPDFARFMDVEYGGVSSGTFSCVELQNRAGEIADRLVTVLAEMHRQLETAPRVI